ncbi:MAG: methyltransferase domain-containing protein [Puniceicoccaceae bacterium]|nr:MAG: methyltransferase domain-containing protein [Puniceicoccaceae bacterium]
MSTFYPSPLERLPPELQQAVADRRVRLREELAHLLEKVSVVTWEIGCGHGHFLAAYAKAHPAEFCLGIDLQGGRLARAERKRAASGLPNLAFLRAEARECLLEWPESTALGAVWVLFPDPWPKKRHHKNRLLGPDFLSLLARRARPGAPLYLRTDHADYFAAVAETLDQHSDWGATEIDPPWPLDQATIFQQRARRFHSLRTRRSGPIPPL